MEGVVLMYLSTYGSPESTGLSLLGRFTRSRPNIMNSPTTASFNAPIYITSHILFSRIQLLILTVARSTFKKLEVITKFKCELGGHEEASVTLN